MKSISILIILFSLWGLVGCYEQPATVPPAETEATAGTYIPGMLNVKFSREVADSLQLCLRRGTNPWHSAVITRAAEGILAVLGEAKVYPLFNKGGKYAARRRAAGLDQWFRLEFDSATDIQEVLGVNTRSGESIECLEPVYKAIFQLGWKMSAEVWSFLHDPFATTVATSGQEMPFNDPMLSKQWHYDHGKMETIAEAGIGLFKAWEKTTGTPNVIVAVLDAGVDHAHEDLAANMWVNQAELNGDSYQDDDNNGYYDDIYGYNFYHDKAAIDPMEHGTHVAGTVAAVNNNGKGVCGVAGGSGRGDGIRVMSCQITGASGGMAGIEDAFAYAADNGAVICTCSWYVVRTGEALKAAIDYFKTNAGSEPGSPMKGGAVFFAAGNDNRTGKVYPPAWENVLAVASVDVGNRRSYFSNFGDWVDLSAPGGGNDTDLEKNILSTLPGNNYGYMMGTSMACPHVAGVAALVVSQHVGEADFTNIRLEEILLQSVADLSSFETDASLMGKGLLRADLAVGADEEQNITPALPENIRLAWQLHLSLNWKAKADKNGNLPSAWLVYITPAHTGKPKIYTTVVSGTYLEGDEVTCPLKPFSLVDHYDITVISRNRWGKLSAPSQAIRLEWNNDYNPPATVTEARITRKDNLYTLRWKQVADSHDGMPVAYNISCRDAQLRLLLDTVVWYGKVPVGQELTFKTELAVGTEEVFFTLFAMDEWFNWGKESQAFGVSEHQEDVSQEAYVYPNPVEKEATLTWNSEWQGEKTIRIYDVSGRLIGKKQIGAAEKSCVLDCSSWAVGWYILRLEGGGRTHSISVRRI